ncbi:hypothetical protein [Nocardioides aurantiacus]|uniref:Uncharacterized protein n=1 Tax=Nocardioides aurantiacus TaxID=86796 RepID=A0A3N2CX36_9ACTN|nr:hypothetical protein [Nocardioides aurantiacus]ROR91784.1 hypothetical protein EDD33_2659 [Nocardioides aurantiacus]
MRAWLRDNGWTGVREAASIFALVPVECARNARDALLRRPHTYR